MRGFILSILDDDHGISEHAWELLRELLQSTGEMALLCELAVQVDAVDGRFFIRSRPQPDREPDEDDSIYYAAPV